ncbi:hypothetical protein DW150_04445 [Phocaeicola vulgatus]|uniref:Uncharacterized protein n=1 Tax=Phocaeicola vulgatus TaxID=821 RepID=A0A415BUU2_PHOVU|nr:hypothetical protein DW150_04445 [Phocaeicola vulgatus]
MPACLHRCQIYNCLNIRYLIDVDNYKWTYCSCCYGYLTEGLASLILTCHQCRFQLDKFCSITNAFCLQLEKMLFRFF